MSHVALLALEFGDANVVVTSLVLVFGMLVALCLIITLEGKMMDRAEKPAAPKPAAPKPAAPARKPAPAAPAVEAGIPAEVVAAIAAAVACTEGGGVIRAVRRAPAVGGSRRGRWGDAGVAANTTPFLA